MKKDKLLLYVLVAVVVIVVIAIFVDERRKNEMALAGQGGNNSFPVQHQTEQIASNKSLFIEHKLFLSIDELDSFAKVREVKPQDVQHLLKYMKDIREKNIKDAFSKIIGENFIQKDSPDEKNDIFSTNFIYEGKRLPTAFLLKGRGTKGALTIGRCGKRGEQILKLSESPANLFVIQHVDKITEGVVKDISQKVKLMRYENSYAYCCIIDGTDTARILKAYGYIS